LPYHFADGVAERVLGALDSVNDVDKSVDDVGERRRELCDKLVFDLGDRAAEAGERVVKLGLSLARGYDGRVVLAVCVAGVAVSGR
jgi:hypothetical protein